MKKPRRRYLVFDVHTPVADLQRGDVEGLLHGRFMEFYGELGAALCRPVIVEYDAENKVGMLKCRHGQVVALRTVLALGLKQNNAPVVIHVVRVTGTMKKARQIMYSFIRPTTFYEPLGSSRRGMKKPSQTTEKR